MLHEKKADHKKVSIVICTYNSVPYLREQIDSILNQTYPIYEIIIQDDCSIDKTVEILQEYERKYPFIRIFQNDYQKGVNENFFSAIERASGDFIAISDQDDIWEPNKIENQVKYIGEMWLCSGFSKPFSEIEYLEYDSRIPNYKIERLIHINSLPGHTMLIKREILPHVLKFRTLPILYDHIFSLIAGSYNKITFVDKILVNHRVHKTSVTYTVPVMNQSGKGNKRLSNIVKSLSRTFFLYMEIKGKIRDWFIIVYQVLQSIPDNDSVKKDAQRIALYQSKKGLISYMKLTCLYVRLHKKIFYVEENNTILSILRAIYFPISCSDYFRYMSKSYQKHQ